MYGALNARVCLRRCWCLQLMCRWVFLTENAVACGALAELAVEGKKYTHNR